MPARPFSCSNCCGEYLPLYLRRGPRLPRGGGLPEHRTRLASGEAGAIPCPASGYSAFLQGHATRGTHRVFAILPPCATLACRDCPGVRMGRSGFGARAGPCAPPCPLSDYKSGPGMWTRATSTAQRVKIARQFGITDAREPV
jgi:hypothetical protein